MATKRDTSKAGPGRDKPRFDTRSQDQVQGAGDPVATPKGEPKTPNERDESARSTGNRMDQPTPVSKRQISQAHDDIEEGRVDTERRGIPNDVPGGGRRGGH